MTDPKNPRIELNPGKTNRLDFDSFIAMNLPGKRAATLRLAFKLIWLAHRIYPQHREKGLRIAHYWHLKQDIEEKVNKERYREEGEEPFKLPITRASIEKAMRIMRKAGYLRYAPLEDRWHLSGKAAGALRTLADKIKDFQEPAIGNKRAEKLIHDFCFGS